MKILLAIILLATTTAHAEDLPAGAVEGHFPIIEAGVLGGFSSTPIPYTLDHGFGPLDVSENVFGGIVAPDVHLHVDAGAFLVNAEGFYNVLGGDVGWMARGQIVLGTGLGFRSRHQVVKSISDSAPSGGYVTRTTEIYTNRYVPMFLGLSAGFAMWSVNESSYTSAVDGTFTRESAMLPAIDVGFTVKSPQLEVTVAPLYELTTGSIGLRWAWSMAFPIGNKPFGFRFTGDHFFGDDTPDNAGRRLGFTMLFSLLLGSGMDLAL